MFRPISEYRKRIIKLKTLEVYNYNHYFISKSHKNNLLNLIPRLILFKSYYFKRNEI